MPKDRPRILFAAGGTGGHLFPAIAIAREVRILEPTAEFLFVGAKGKIEERIVPEQGFPLRTIWISGFARSFKLSNLLVPLKVLVSIMQSLSHIRSFQPDVVVGTGGFVTGPVVYAATFRKVPTLIQEQNSFPGFTTRKLAKRVDEIHIAFEVSTKFLKSAKKIKLSGNPTRDSLKGITREAASNFFHLDPRKKTLLVFGGSHGAASINTAVLELVDDLTAADIQLIWQTGGMDYDEMRQATAGSQGIRVEKFIDRMEYAYAAADLVVSRAGAVTIAELTRLGKAAVLVPYPHAAAGHQLLNARSLVDVGAATIVLDHELPSKLKGVVFELLQDKTQREALGAKALSLGKPHAAREIAEAVLHLVRTE